jgi:hypothetical protein
VIARFGDRALLIHLYRYSIGDQGLLGEDPSSGFKTPIVGRIVKIVKTSIPHGLGRTTLLYPLLLTLDREPRYVYVDLAHV